jgi:hypothetical protein
LRSRQALLSAFKRSRSSRLIRRISVAMDQLFICAPFGCRKISKDRGRRRNKAPILSSPKGAGFFSRRPMLRAWIFLFRIPIPHKPGSSRRPTRLSNSVFARPFGTVPGLIGVIDPAQQYEDPASEPFFDHIHGLVIAVTSVLACIPSRYSRGQVQVVKRILLFGLYWNGASGRFLRTVFSMISASVTPKRIAVSDNRLANASSFMNTRILGRGILGGLSSTHLGTRCKPSAGTCLE